MAFIDDVLGGAAALSDLDDYIDTWHEDLDARVPLHEYLGLSWAQCAVITQEPAALPYVVNAHGAGQDLVEYLAEREDGDPTAHRVREIAVRYQRP